MSIFELQTNYSGILKELKDILRILQELKDNLKNMLKNIHNHLVSTNRIALSGWITNYICNVFDKAKMHLSLHHPIQIITLSNANTSFQ